MCRSILLMKIDARKRNEEGDSVLRRLHDKPLEHPDVQNMKDEILAAIELEEASEVRFNPLDLLWDRSDIRAGRRIRVGFLVLAIQQLMGINLSVYYSTVVFSQVGLSPFLSSLLAAVMNSAFAAGTFFLPAGPLGIERIGRRNVMMWSAGVLTICLLIFTAMINLPNKNTATQWTGVAFINIYNFVFGYGWIGVPWLYGPEVLATPLFIIKVYALTYSDRTPQTPPSRWRSRRLRRMEHVLRDSVCGRHRSQQRGTPDLDLDVTKLRPRGAVCVFHVS